ncbi:MAG: transglutaminase family protein, partial [Planctomycetes bacterium]|nr:transglutaminase family protein [Planctomycetota bacterium]
NTDIQGLAFDEVSPDAPRLLVLDGAGKVFAYRLKEDAAAGIDELELLRVLALPAGADGSTPASPRGLALSMERSREVLYYLSWSRSPDAVASRLWRWSPHGGDPIAIDISMHPFRIGDREVHDMAFDRGNLWISFDATGYSSGDLRVQRGILHLRRSPAEGGRIEFVRHLPDSGKEPSHGVATTELGGVRYLWGTIGGESIYAAEAATGRGIFYFDRPRSAAGGVPCRGLCSGRDSLWIGENRRGPALVHRVNVTRNLDARREGPRSLRRLVMEIDTEPEKEVGSAGAGKVSHFYSRPCAYEQLHNQGVWLETEEVTDLSGATNAAIKSITHDPAGDVSSRQHLRLVEYADAPARSYSSRYEVDLWLNSCRRFIYPHRANRDRKALEGTSYLADDPVLYNLKDRKTYNDFFKRVRAHIETKYGAPADLENPYWAARNALEYIQDSYYYPSRPKGVPASVDYDRDHYDANPGNLKIELSAREYDRTQIIACSGTSVMLAGAMRHLGIPARWLGTGTQQGPSSWDANDNGLLDEGESAPCTNGHRYTQVWLGSDYGWVCFDATPSKPELNDYDPPPPLQPQHRYMSRAAAGHMVERRIVFNAGSELLLPLYRDFEYDELLAVDNNCGGDQRYNLQGRFEKPELWKLARQRIELKNSCFLRDIALSRSGGAAKVTWRLAGAWERDPGATVSIHLQRIDVQSGKARDAEMLAARIPATACEAAVDLAGHRRGRFRIIIRKDGDEQTGGQSEVLDID